MMKLTFGALALVGAKTSSKKSVDFLFRRRAIARNFSHKNLFTVFKYPHQLSVDTVHSFTDSLCRRRPTLVLTGTSIPCPLNYGL